MAGYVDGFVIPIKKKNLKVYKKMASLGCKVWMEHGATSYFECVGDDMSNGWGMGFKKMCKLKPDETIVFAFITYKSKSDRNRINKKVMSDSRMQMTGKPMPFDLKRFAMAGLKVLVAKD